VSFENLFGKKPETVWPVRAFLSFQDETGEAIALDDLRDATSGTLWTVPAVGDTMSVRVGDEFQHWKVVGRHWMHLFPAEGQMRPGSAVNLELRRVKAK
jgi:hypothetical protein